MDVAVTLNVDLREFPKITAKEAVPEDEAQEPVPVKSTI